MVEVLVTIVILAFGLLGLAAFQLRMQTAELESFQRAQALVLLNDMAGRIQARRGDAAQYVGTDYGTGTAACTGAAGSVDGDKCAWSALLRGAAERRADSVSGSGVGAMVGARGCVVQVQSANASAGVCAPGIYRVDVAWQGLVSTAVPASTCGSGQYGAEAQRRVVSKGITLGLMGCR